LWQELQLDALDGLVIRALPELVVQRFLCGAAARAEDCVPGLRSLLKVLWRRVWVILRLWLLLIALPVEVHLPLCAVHVACRARRAIGSGWEGGEKGRAERPRWVGVLSLRTL
jgi:hypothetical protein